LDLSKEPYSSYVNPFFQREFSTYMQQLAWMPARTPPTTFFEYEKNMSITKSMAMQQYNSTMCPLITI